MLNSPLVCSQVQRIQKSSQGFNQLHVKNGLTPQTITNQNGIEENGIVYFSLQNLTIKIEGQNPIPTWETNNQINMRECVSQDIMMQEAEIGETQ